jgi:hypothetical protein
MSLEKVLQDATAAHDRAKSELLPRALRIRESLRNRCDEPKIRSIVENFSVEKICTSQYFHLDWGNGRRESRYFDRERYSQFVNGEIQPSWSQLLKEKCPDRVTTIQPTQAPYAQ